MPLIEANVEALWAAKQTAKGTPATTATKRFRKVGGDIAVTRDDGNENYSDGSRFTNSTPFVNTLRGNGEPVVQGQASIVGYLSYLLLGSEVVTGTGPYTHVATPGANSFWATFWKKVGAQVGPLRQKFNDCRISQLVYTASEGSKVLHVTPTIESMDPGEIYATDPTQAQDTGEPFLFTEAEGAYLVDGTVIRGVSEFNVTVGDALTPVYGDSVVPWDVASGLGQVTCSATVTVDPAGLGVWFTKYYGSATPSVGTKPLKVPPAPGSFSFNMARGTTEKVQIELPNVDWEPAGAIAGNPDGGTVTFGLAGKTRAIGVNPHIRVTTISADAAYT